MAFKLFGKKIDLFYCKWEGACDCGDHDKPVDKLKTCSACRFYYCIDSGYGWCRAFPKFELVPWCRDACGFYKGKPVG